MKRFIHPILGLCLLAGFFTSCGKESKLTIYQLYCDTMEFTQPQTIADSDVRSVYMQFLSDLGGLSLNETWQVWVVNDRFDAEDTKAKALYDSHLPEVKALESAYKKRIGELGAHDQSAFYAKVVYKLSKSVPADNASDCLREYIFELNYD